MHVSRFILICLVVALPISGCGKKKEPPPPVKQGPPPPPPAPDPVILSTLYGEVAPDARVNFDQRHAPVDRELAKSVIRLCNAIARKDASAMRPLLDPAGKAALAQVEQEWADLEIEAVRVVYLDSNAKSSAEVESAPVVTAVKTNEAVVLVWNARRFGDGWVFSPSISSTQSMPVASDWDDKSMTEYVGGIFGLPPAVESLLENEPPTLTPTDGTNTPPSDPGSLPPPGNGPAGG